jgi:hypothetical protein
MLIYSSLCQVGFSSLGFELNFPKRHVPEFMKTILATVGALQADLPLDHCMVTRIEDGYEDLVTRKISGMVAGVSKKIPKADVDGLMTKFAVAGVDTGAEMDTTTVEYVKAHASSESSMAPFMSRMDQIKPEADEEGTTKPILAKVLDVNECFGAAMHRLNNRPDKPTIEEGAEGAEGAEGEDALYSSTASTILRSTTAKGDDAHLCAPLLGDLSALRASLMDAGPIFDGIVARDLPWIGDTGVNLLLEAPAMSAGCGQSIVALQLRNVNCTASGITVLGQEAASALTALKVLDLGYNNLGNKGAITISNMLKTVAGTLQYLSLDHCGIGKTGSKAVFGVLALRRIQLVACDMSYNTLGVGGTKMASEWLTHANVLTQLGLAGTKLAMASFLEALLNKGRNPKLAMEVLSELDLSWNAPEGKAISAKSVRLLGDIMSTSASLEFCKFSGLGLNHQTVKKLLNSAIGNQKFSDEFITSRALILNHNEFKGAKVPLSLLFECQPVTVDLSHCALGANGIIRLCNAIISTQNSSVTSLRINSNAPLGAISQSLLEKAGDALSQLMQVNGCKISELGLAGDGLDYGLQSAVLPVMTATGEGKCASLTSLDVSGNSCKGLAKEAAKLIGAKTFIQTLRWDGNNTKPAGMQEICSALESNTTLKGIEMPIQDTLKLAKKSKTVASQMLYWTQQMARSLLAKGVKALKPAVYDAPPEGTEELAQVMAKEEFRVARGRGISVFADDLDIRERSRGASVLSEAAAGGGSDDEAEDATAKKEEMEEEEAENAGADDDDDEIEAENDESDEDEVDEEEEEDLREVAMRDSARYSLDNTPLTTAQIEQFSMKYQASEADAISGWLMKKDPKRNRWRSRMFTLEGRMLCYYVDTGKTQLKGSIDLTQAHDFQLQPKLKGPSVNHEVFSFFTGTGAEVAGGKIGGKRKKVNRKWVFAAESGQAMDWIGRIARLQQLANVARQQVTAGAAGLSGWLWKRTGTGINKRWKKRFFAQNSDVLSYSLDGASAETVGVMNVNAITELRLSTKTKCPKGSKALKLVTADRIWVLAVPRSEGTAEQWLASIQALVPQSDIVDEKDYIHRKKEKKAGVALYKMVPYSIDIEVASAPGTEVTDAETTAMRGIARGLNASHSAHMKNGTEMPKVVCETIIPANDPAEDAKAAGMPEGAAKGWCSWCFGVPAGRGGTLADRQGAGTQSWMVPKLKSPFTPKEGKIGGDGDEGGGDDDDEGDEEGEEEEGGDEEPEEEGEEDGGMEMEMEFDASDMSMDIVPSLEDTIELLAKLGKNLATGDRPKLIIDKLKRVGYKCTNCTRETVKCAHKDCGDTAGGHGAQGYARFTAYQAEAYCYKHVRELQTGPTSPPDGFEGGMIGSGKWKLKMVVIQKMPVVGKDTFKDWGDVPNEVRGFEGHCSWCYEKTAHSLSLPLPGKPSLYKCGGCSKQTQKCKQKGCEDFGIGGQKKCAVHSKQTLPGWADSDKAAYLDTLKLERFCSWCFDKTTHTPVGRDPDSGGSRVQYSCGGCGLKTLPCTLPSCDYAMAGGNAYGGASFCLYHSKFKPPEEQHFFYHRLQNRVSAAEAAAKSSKRTVLQEVQNDRASYVEPINLKETDVTFLDEKAAEVKAQVAEWKAARKAKAEARIAAIEAANNAARGGMCDPLATRCSCPYPLTSNRLSQTNHPTFCNQPSLQIW